MAVVYFKDTYASVGKGEINYDKMPAYIEFRRNFLRGFLCISERLFKAHIINAKGNSIEPTILLMVNFFL